MRKIYVVLVTTVFLLCFGTVYAFANSGDTLSYWYKDRFQETADQAASAVMEGITTMEGSVSQQKEASLREMEKRFDHFFWTSSTKAKKNLENHQRANLNQLMETKEALKDQNFDEYTEQKNKEINVEITQDVEAFLTELLAE